MIGINWYAIDITTNFTARHFKPFFVPVMAWLAQRLPVVSIPKQLHIAFMGRDVIHHRGFNYLAKLKVHGTNWVLDQISLARLLPP